MTLFSPPRRLWFATGVAALVVLSLSVAACGAGDEGDVLGEPDSTASMRGRESASESETRGVDVGERNLVLDGFAGSVTVTAEPGAEQARLTFTRIAHGATPESAAARLGSISIEETGDEEIYQYVWRSSLNEGVRVDAEATVPPETPVVVRLSAGDVRLGGLTETVDVATEGGDVTASGLEGRMITLVTTAGTIRASAAAVPDSARWDVRSGGGDVRIGLPVAAAVQIQTETDAGAIRVEGLDVQNETRETDGSRARLRGNLGDGGALLQARTNAGDVVLRAGTVE